MIINIIKFKFQLTTNAATTDVLAEYLDIGAGLDNC